MSYKPAIKILTLAVLSVSFVSQAFAAGATSFYDYTPSAQTVNGEAFPRNNKTLFRGTTDHQMDLTKAISAMLGDVNANVESLFFSTIKNQLMQVNFPPAVGLNSYLQSEIGKAIQANGGPLKLTAAVKATRKLVDSTFAYYDQTGTAVAQNVNYRSGSYSDWPNDIIFSTLLSPVAGTYGDRMLVIKEQKPRSLDLNFWNYVNNGLWYDHTRDIGEFIAFGYLPAGDVQGYQVRAGGNKGWHYVQLAVYKNPAGKGLLVFAGERQDGSTSTCIDQNRSNKVFYHCDYRAGSIVNAVPNLSNEKVQLAGVIGICASEDDASCELPNDAETAKYPKKSLSRDATEALRAAVKGLKVQGQRLKVEL
jgi:hypothetical protein